MRKAIFVISVAVLLATSGPTAHAYVLERVWNYYTDATFTTACGYVDWACATTYSDGCPTNFFYAEIYSCESGEHMSSPCREWNGTQWVDVACRDEPVTALARVHIPVG